MRNWDFPMNVADKGATNDDLSLLLEPRRSPHRIGDFTIPIGPPVALIQARFKTYASFMGEVYA